MQAKKSCFLLLVGVVALQCVLATPILPKLSVKTVRNYEEISGKFEGDLDLTDEQLTALFAPASAGRNGLVNVANRWPSKIVPYVFSNQQDDDQKAYIVLALQKIMDVTCIRFVERTDEVDYVEITGNDSGCHSNVGYLNRGRQTLNLQLFVPEMGCFRQRTIIHEFLHTLGFYHMQSNYDRDDYVKIVWENIIPSTVSNFNKYTEDRITNFGEIYDIRSIMHYAAYAFTSNGYATIVPEVTVEIIFEFLLDAT